MRACVCSFNREVLALVADPSKIDHPKILQIYTADAVVRARRYIAKIPGGIGAYSNSQGLGVIRGEVADFITRRDGFGAKAENIYMTDGVSAGVRLIMTTILSPGRDGILVPFPQYPIYTALGALLNVSTVGYYLDEATGWSLDVAELERALATSLRTNPDIKIKAIVIISPGNPTGQRLSIENMEQIVRFCVENGLMLIADEVYQDNVYSDGPGFHSFKKVLSLMAESRTVDNGIRSGAQQLELVSFHSISKGYYGECGFRGGYFELQNFEAEVKAEMYKLASLSICANTPGQIATGLMVNPPQPDDASYALWQQQRQRVLASLKRRAEQITSTLQRLPGVTCNTIEGAMYAFPQVMLPDRAIEFAAKSGIAPDLLYCLELLNATGIVTVPGSGFRQREGTYHFRTTILPPEEQVSDYMRLITEFHTAFLQRYTDDQVREDL